MEKKIENSERRRKYRYSRDDRAVVALLDELPSTEPRRLRKKFSNAISSLSLSHSLSLSLSLSVEQRQAKRCTYGAHFFRVYTRGEAWYGEINGYHILVTSHRNCFYVRREETERGKKERKKKRDGNRSTILQCIAMYVRERYTSEESFRE